MHIYFNTNPIDNTFDQLHIVDESTEGNPLDLFYSDLLDYPLSESDSATLVVYECKTPEPKTWKKVDWQKGFEQYKKDLEDEDSEDFGEAEVAEDVQLPESICDDGSIAV